MAATISHPAIALPEPLRAAEIPSFTNYSVVVRLPDIARRALKENQFLPQTVELIQQLINEIPEGKIRQVEIPLAQDAEQWANYIRPYEGMNWLEIPWFFAEEYFYLRILEATGYYQLGPGFKLDPYASQKQLGLQSSRDAIRIMADQIGYVEHRPASTYRDSLARLILIDLWGNQNDLSMWPVQASGSGNGLTGGSALSNPPANGGGNGSSNGGNGGSGSDEMRAARKNILCDDLALTLDYLNTLPPSTARIDILLDNAGYELVCDLALADFLLSSQCAAQVTLHAKSHPVFVSDALEMDVHDTLEFLLFEGHLSCQNLAVRLRSCLLNERLVLRRHPFWTSPLPAWDMPDDLFNEISKADLLISKGDANYRRLLGDRHWPIDLPFSRVVDYLPCAALALRTLKSEITVGVEADRIPTSDPDWMIDGRWGLVQFTPPHR